jgi:hypothetical protein
LDQTKFLGQSTGNTIVARVTASKGERILCKRNLRVESCKPNGGRDTTIVEKICVRKLVLCFHAVAAAKLQAFSEGERGWAATTIASGLKKFWVLENVENSNSCLVVLDSKERTTK